MLKASGHRGRPSQSLCENLLSTVIPSEARNLALSPADLLEITSFPRQREFIGLTMAPAFAGATPIVIFISRGGATGAWELLNFSTPGLQYRRNKARMSMKTKDKVKKAGSHGQRFSDRGLFFPHVPKCQVPGATSMIQRSFGIEVQPTVTNAVTVATRSTTGPQYRRNKARMSMKTKDEVKEVEQSRSQRVERPNRLKVSAQSEKRRLPLNSSTSQLLDCSTGGTKRECL